MGKLKENMGCRTCGYTYGPDQCNGNCFMTRPQIITRTMEDVNARFKQFYQRIMKDK